MPESPDELREQADQVSQDSEADWQRDQDNAKALRDAADERERARTEQEEREKSEDENRGQDNA